VMGIHPIFWEASSDYEILQDLKNDGEISDNLRRALQEDTFEPLSLDDLLSDQE